MATSYIVWVWWAEPSNPRFTNVTDAFKKAYVMSKQPKYKHNFVKVAKMGGKNADTNWRFFMYTTLANGKKEVVVMNNDLNRQRIVKANGELGDAVKNKAIMRNGKHIGDMQYVGELPSKGLFYNYETNKMDTYVRKR